MICFKVNPMTVATEMMNVVSNSNHIEEELIGFNLPMPFGMKPLNVQVCS